MRNVVILCIIFMPVLVLGATYGMSSFEHTEEIGNTALNSIKNILVWIDEKGNAVSDFVNSDTFSSISADLFHSPYKPVGDYTAEDIYNAVSWEIKNGTMNFWQSAWFQIKWDFLRASYGTIVGVCDWDLYIRYIYPSD